MMSAARLRQAAVIAAIALLASGAAAQPLDVDRDGRVDVYTDLVYIGRYLLGLAPVPPSFRTPGTTPIPSDEEIGQRIAELAGTARPTDTPPATPTQTHTASPSASATASVAPPTETVAVPTLTASRTRTPGTPSRTPTPSPTFSISEGADVVRAAAEVFVQNVESFADIDLGCVIAGCNATAASGAFRFAAGARRGIAGGAPRGLAAACAGGGTKQETCSTGVQSIVFDHCIEPGAAGTTVERDGTVVFTVASAGFCSSMEVEPLTTSALELQDFVLVERDAQSDELARVEADWLDTLIPTGLGCVRAGEALPLVDGFQEVRGRLRIECRSGSQVVPCPRGSTDLTLQSGGLEILRESSGAPCELSLSLDGGLRVDDRDANLGAQACRTEFAQTFDEFLLSEAPDGAGSSNVRQSGRLAVDRFGPLDVAMVPAAASVRFVGGKDCPTGGDGEVEVRRPPQTAALGFFEAPRFRFQQNGGEPQVVFDFLGGDPQGIQTVAGCIGISPLTTCE